MSGISGWDITPELRLAGGERMARTHAAVSAGVLAVTEAQDCERQLLVVGIIVSRLLSDDTNLIMSRHRLSGEAELVTCRNHHRFVVHEAEAQGDGERRVIVATWFEFLMDGRGPLAMFVTDPPRAEFADA